MGRFGSSLILGLLLALAPLKSVADVVIWSGDDAEFLNSGSIIVPGLSSGGGVCTIDGSGKFGNGSIDSILPSQTGNSGKFLKTDGTNASWQLGGSGVTSVSSGDGSLDVTNPTTTPDVRLHLPANVAGGTAAAPNLDFGGSGLYEAGFGRLGISTSGVSRCIFENNGDIGCTGTLNFTGPATFSGNIAAANYPPVGSANTLARYDNSGVLSSSLWGINPDTMSLGMINSLGTPIVGDYSQFFNQTNMPSVSGTARSIFTSLQGSDPVGSLVGYQLDVGAPVTNDLNLLSLNAGNSTTVGGNAVGIGVYTDTPVTGNMTSLNISQTNTVGGNYNGSFINSGATTTGDAHLYSGSSYGNTTGSLSFYDANNSGSVGNNFNAATFNNSGKIGNFGSGVTISQTGAVTKGFDAFNAYINANVGDGTGVNLNGVNIGTQSGNTIDGNFFGFNVGNNATVNQQFVLVNGSNSASYAGAEGLNFTNSGNMTGNNTLFGANIFNSGTGYSFTGFNAYNEGNMTEEVRGFQFRDNNTSARTKTGLDIYMEGTATDDVQGMRINVSDQTSSSTTQHVYSGQFNGGLFTVNSDFTPFNGTAGPVEVGNNISATATIQSGSPLTGADLILGLDQTNLVVNDDISTGPIGLNTTMNAMVSLLAVASGKTVPLLRSMLLGTSVPTGSGGTVTEYHVLDLVGLYSFGGSVSNPTRVGISDSYNILGQALCNGATDCWAIKMEDPAAENYFGKLAINTASKKVSSSSVGLEINDKHIKHTQATPPTASVQTSAGTGASCSVSAATDVAGQIEIDTGTTGLSTGSYCKVTFNSAYGVAPICVLTPANSTISNDLYVTSTTTDFDVNFAVAGGISSTYLINYHCLETQ